MLRLWANALATHSQLGYHQSTKDPAGTVCIGGVDLSSGNRVGGPATAAFTEETPT